MHFSLTIGLILSAISIAIDYFTDPCTYSPQKCIVDPPPQPLIPFQTEIDGNILVYAPDKVTKDANGKTTEIYLTIYMSEVNLQLLPQKYGKTKCYVYGGKVQGSSEITYSYPGPAIIVQKGVAVIVTYVNNITGPHILPMDRVVSSYLQGDKVPAIVHVHGGVNPQSSDGYPTAHNTIDGQRGSQFFTQNYSLPNNSVQLRYQNQQNAGILWYHDHTMGITRLNVYAGLAGYYEIIQTGSSQETNLLNYYGDIERKYFIISDKSFKTDGSLYYPDKAKNKDFESWVPQFFGENILVNGKVWPIIKLQKNKYRIVFLNACNSRHLNIYFEDDFGTKVPFDIIRKDGDYYQKSITINKKFLQPSARMEIVIDLSSVSSNLILKNDATSPNPDGDKVNPITTGIIMKIVLPINNVRNLEQKDFKPSPQFSQSQDQKKYPMYQSDYQTVTNCVIQPFTQSFPRYSAGTPVYFTLIETQSDGQVAGSFIDGIPFPKSQQCTGRTFNLGQIYDLYFINLTPDSHPMHIHIANFQKVAVIPFDVEKYKQDYYKLNGEPPAHGYTTFPQNMDPTSYFTGPSITFQPIDEVFRDVETVLPYHVTILRVKFSHIDDSPFPSTLSGGKFVFHCHILEHEDNDMMTAMCLV